MPTLLHACGVDITKHCDNTPNVDGLNVWDTLIGKKEAKHPRKELLFWHGKGDLHAIRSGKWKLFLKREYLGIKGEGSVLFNMEEDPEEKNDLSAKHPDLVQELYARAEELHYAMKENSMQLGCPEF